MDKHDRPYRCQHAGCAKLQGFTYSGGLLRHEREVHGKHGGPKSQLMCPFTDCKRHTGKGFTRKENLNEHLRRVHQGRETTSQQDTMLDQNGEVVPGPDDGDTQMSHMTAAAGEELSQLEPKLKRKRSMPPQPQDEYGAPHLPETQEEQIARMTAENALQADRIRQLEASAAMNAEKMQRLEETLTLWAQQTGQAQVQHEQQPQESVQQQEEHQGYVQQPTFEEQLAEQAGQQHVEPQYAEQPLPEQQYADPKLAEPQQQYTQQSSTEADVKAALQQAQET